jgi:hypothetical protein
LEAAPSSGSASEDSEEAAQPGLDVNWVDTDYSGYVLTNSGNKIATGHYTFKDPFTKELLHITPSDFSSVTRRSMHLLWRFVMVVDDVSFEHPCNRRRRPNDLTTFVVRVHRRRDHDHRRGRRVHRVHRDPSAQHHDHDHDDRLDNHRSHHGKRRNRADSDADECLDFVVFDERGIARAEDGVFLSTAPRGKRARTDMSSPVADAGAR